MTDLAHILALLAIERQLDVSRLAAGFTNEMLVLLAEVRSEVAAKLQEADLTSYQRSRLEILLAETGEIIQAGFADLDTDLHDKLGDFVLQEGAWFVESANQAIGVSVMQGVASQPLLAALSEPDFLQGAPLSDWISRQGEQASFRLAQAVRLGVAQGETTQQIVRRLDAEVFGIAARDMESLVLTATNTAGSKARLASYRANPDVIKGMRQLSTLDGRTSDVCMAYSGAEWTLEGVPINGTRLPFRGGTPRHWRCRSMIVPITKTFRELGLDVPEFSPSTRAGMDGPVSADITFDDFLKSKGKAFQDERLGDGRAELWRSGQITLAQLLNQKGNPLTLDQLRSRYDMRSGYERAKAGGLYSGYYNLVKDYPPRRLNKAKASFEKRIAEHRAWIDNPYLKVDKDDPNNNAFDVANYINKKWPADIRRLEASLSVVEGVLREKGL